MREPEDDGEVSKHGINFVDKWMAEHLPNAIADDPVAVSDLADEMMKAPQSAKGSLPMRSTKKSTASTRSFSKRCSKD